MNLDHVPPQTVRFWAWVDSSVTWILAIPPLATGFIRLLYRINGAIGGTAVPPTFAPVQLFFVCLGGALVSVWVIARLLKPLGIFALIDGYGRLWVAGLIVYFVVARGMPQVILFFVLTEGTGAIAQLRAVYRQPNATGPDSATY